MKIVCIGKNYVEHIKELNSNQPDEPVFFMKPSSSILKNNRSFVIPDWSNDLHYEVELILYISQTGKNIKAEEATQYFDQIGLGIDFTARDLQYELVKKGLPWEKCKAFDDSAVVSENFINISDFQNINSINFHLDKNGKTVQKGNSEMMIFNFNIIISYISQFITLNRGDLIFTGTPAGVGPVKAGDHLEGYLEGNRLLDLIIE